MWPSLRGTCLHKEFLEVCGVTCKFWIFMIYSFATMTIPSSRLMTSDAEGLTGGYTACWTSYAISDADSIASPKS